MLLKQEPEERERWEERGWAGRAKKEAENFPVCFAMLPLSMILVPLYKNRTREIPEWKWPQIKLFVPLPRLRDLSGLSGLRGVIELSGLHFVPFTPWPHPLTNQGLTWSPTGSRLSTRVEGGVEVRMGSGVGSKEIVRVQATRWLVPATPQPPFGMQAQWLRSVTLGRNSL